MNHKHFKMFVRKNSPGIFSLDSGLSNEEIDKVLSKFLDGKNPADFYGKTTRI